VSWTRRLLVTCAFALMIVGVALMIIQEDELFLALSLAGFALVLAAVPSLPREAESGAGEGLPPAPEAGPVAAEPESAEPPPPGPAAAVPAGPEPEPVEPEPTKGSAEDRDEPLPAPAAAAAPPAAAQAPEPPARAAAAAPGHPVGGEPGGPLGARSARDLALVGAAAGAALWLWRRVRR
jgi:outer membrane biosynthesis protein TonB